jgi:hypothetical protein
VTQNALRVAPLDVCLGLRGRRGVADVNRRIADLNNDVTVVLMLRRAPTSLSSCDVSRKVVHWKFYFGACLLTAAMLMPHAATGPLLAGMVLAGVIQVVWSRVNGR